MAVKHKLPHKVQKHNTVTEIFYQIMNINSREKYTVIGLNGVIGQSSMLVKII